jgi:sugar phosphate isomerase/epimerase
MNFGVHPAVLHDQPLPAALATIRSLHRVDPDTAVNIEHEDIKLDQLEGLRVVATTLREASALTPQCL